MEGPSTSGCPQGRPRLTIPCRCPVCHRWHQMSGRCKPQPGSASGDGGKYSKDTSRHQLVLGVMQLYTYKSISIHTYVYMYVYVYIYVCVYPSCSTFHCKIPMLVGQIAERRFFAKKRAELTHCRPCSARDRRLPAEMAVSLLFTLRTAVRNLSEMGKKMWHALVST